MTMTRIDMTNIVNIDTFPQVRAGYGAFNELPKVIYRTLAGSLSTTGEMTAFLLTDAGRSEEHTSELQSRGHLVCRLLLEKKKRLLARRAVAPPSLPAG